MFFEPWMLAAMDAAGYNGIREDHIEAVAAELLGTGLTEIDEDTFRTACRRCAIDPDNFTQSNLDELETMLNGGWMNSP